MINLKKYALMFSVAIGTTLLLSNNAFANDVKVVRIAGQDRYETSAKIAEVTANHPSHYAVLCNGEAYADSVLGSPIACHDEAPILLVQRDSIPQEIKEQLVKLRTKKVFLMGGTSLISENVEQELANMGISIEARISGQDRYETSAKASHYVISRRTAFLLYGDDIQNMLSVAPISARKQIPILLTERDNLSESVKQKNLDWEYNCLDLVTEKNQCDNMWRLAQQSDIPFNVMTSGRDKTDTNIQVYKTFKNDVRMDRIILVSKDGLADGLCVAPFAGASGTMVWYVDRNNIEQIRSFLYDYRSKIKDIYVIGGEQLIPDTWVNAIKNDVVSYMPVVERSERNKPLVVSAPKSQEEIDHDKKMLEYVKYLNEHGIKCEQGLQTMKDLVKNDSIYCMGEGFGNGNIILDTGENVDDIKFYEYFLKNNGEIITYIMDIGTGKIYKEEKILGQGKTLYKLVK